MVTEGPFLFYLVEICEKEDPEPQLKREVVMVLEKKPSFIKVILFLLCA